MVASEATDDEADRESSGDFCQLRLAVKPRDERGDAESNQCDCEAGEQVDPEEGARLFVGEFCLLNHRGGEAEIFEECDEAGYDDDHADETVIMRGEQACEYERGGRHDDKLQRLGRNHHGAAAHGTSAEVLFQLVGGEVVGVAAVTVEESGHESWRAGRNSAWLILHSKD